MTIQISKTLSGFTATLWFELGMVMPLAAITFHLWYLDTRRRKQEKPPQNEKLLRPAGYSLGLRLDDAVRECLELIVKSSLLCGGGAAISKLAAGLLMTPVPLVWGLGSAGVALACLGGGGLCLRKSLKLINEIRNLKLGMRGEQAVAEVLHEVAGSGYRAFHDLPGGENWNIDHVAVGSKGVFLIETKARRKGQARGNQQSYVVRVENQVLRFPTGFDREAIAQAGRNAKWLANYLGRKTGEVVEVEALVVVPGWFVENTSATPEKVKVMNTTYLSGFLSRQEEKLPSAQVRRIITALEEKCRDVEFW